MTYSKTRAKSKAWKMEQILERALYSRSQKIFFLSKRRLSLFITMYCLLCTLINAQTRIHPHFRQRKKKVMVTYTWSIEIDSNYSTFWFHVNKTDFSPLGWEYKSEGVTAISLVLGWWTVASPSLWTPLKLYGQLGTTICLIIEYLTPHMHVKATSHS